jgi:hypothetical protein
LEVAYAVSKVIFLDEHFVAVEDMGFPVKNFELRKRVENTDDEGLLDLDYFRHCVRRGLRVEEIGNQRFKAEGFACKHGLFIDYAIICKLDCASSLLDEIEMFCYLIVINYALIGIKGELLA